MPEYSAAAFVPKNRFSLFPVFANEGHRVVAHHAAALVVRDNALNDGVAGGHALHHAHAGDEEP